MKLVSAPLQTFTMTLQDYPIVASFKNDTDGDLSLFLELVPDLVILSPGDEVELLARPSEFLLPLDIQPVEGGFHIHAHKEFDPDWYVRFRGQVVKANHPTRLSNYR
jgi:hypothetical protein